MYIVFSLISGDEKILLLVENFQIKESCPDAVTARKMNINKLITLVII